MRGGGGGGGGTAMDLCLPDANNSGEQEDVRVYTTLPNLWIFREREVIGHSASSLAFRERAVKGHSASSLTFREREVTGHSAPSLTFCEREVIGHYASSAFDAMVALTRSSLP